MLPIKFEGLFAVSSFRHHNHIRDGVDERDETLAHDRLVVNHHNFDRVVIHKNPRRLSREPSGSIEKALPSDVRKASGLPETAFNGLGLCPARGVAPTIFLRIAGRPEAFRTSGGIAEDSPSSFDCSSTTDRYVNDDLRSFAFTTIYFQRAANPHRTFLHTDQTEMFYLAILRRLVIKTVSVILHT